MQLSASYVPSLLITQTHKGHLQNQEKKEKKHLICKDVDKKKKTQTKHDFG